MSLLDLVRDFHLKFKQPVGEKLGLLTDDRNEKREAWLDLECTESDEAHVDGNLPESVDADIARIYFLLGNLVEKGITTPCFFELFDAVNAANMAKEGGGMDETGKLRKPPGWTPPDIAGILRRHGWAG